MFLAWPHASQNYAVFASKFVVDVVLAGLLGGHGCVHTALVISLTRSTVTCKCSASPSCLGWQRLWGDMHLPCRKGHMAACHNGAVFVMEGEHDPSFLNCVIRSAREVHVQVKGCSVVSG